MVIELCRFHLDADTLSSFVYQLRKGLLLPQTYTSGNGLSNGKYKLHLIMNGMFLNIIEVSTMSRLFEL